MYHLSKFFKEHKNTSRSLFFLLLMWLFTVVATADVNLKCAAPNQANSETALWQCPSIDNKLYSQLTDVNLVTGAYACTYNYKEGGRLATVCEHTSEKYQSQLETYMDRMDAKSLAYSKYDFDTDAKMISTLTTAPAIKNIETLSNGVIEKLNDFNKEAMKHKEDGISGADQEIQSMQQIIYDHLKKPYSLNNPNPTEKRDTLSRFIAGLITLDPEIAKGYDESTGDLIITKEWKDKSSVISTSEQSLIDKVNAYLPWTDNNPLTGLGNIMKEKGNKSSIDTDTYNVSSWLDIFTMKIWGFYYDLHRNLDIGFDKLLTTMLFLFLVFMGGALAIRGGTAFALGRKQGVKNQKFQLSDKGAMNMIAVLSAFVIFFISVPSPISSNNTVTKAADLKNEMTMNNSLFKWYIRYMAKEGSYFSDMFSDLGTSAFLNYMIKKQGLYTGSDIRKIFNADARQMVYYYPSLQIAQECEKFYGRDANAFIGARSTTQYSTENNYAANSDFFKNNKVDGVDFKLCQKMHKNLILVPYNIVNSAATTEEKLNNVSKTRAKSTRFIIENHVLLQEKLGWINSISVPVTYVMMNDHDLFFENNLDFDNINDKTKKYVKNVGLKDSGDLELDFSNMGFGEYVSAKTGKLRNFAADNSAYRVSILTKFAYYNFLPGFTGIKNSIDQSLTGDSNGGVTKIDKNGNRYKDGDSLAKLKEKVLQTFGGGKFADAVQKMSSNGIVYMAAIIAWKEAFKVVSIAIISGLFMALVMVWIFMAVAHLIATPFMFLWTLKGGTSVGINRLKVFSRNTIIIFFTPILISLGALIFPFIMTFFHTIYSFTIGILVEQQMNLVSLSITGQNQLKQDAFSSYLTLYSVLDVVELMILLGSVAVAFLAMKSLMVFIKNQIGVNDNTDNIGSATGDEMTSKINTNPLFR